MDVSGKADRIDLFTFATPAMRAFHMSWLAFFLCFFAWFGIAPLMPVVREEFGLTKDQIGWCIIGSVALTIVARLCVGSLCDRFGPRLLPPPGFIDFDRRPHAGRCPHCRGASSGKWGGPGWHGWSDPRVAAAFAAEEAAIVRYVRQLMRTNRAEQAAFEALHGRYGTKWLVELTACVHYFAMLCGVVNAFEVAAPPDGDKLPA